MEKNGNSIDKIACSEFWKAKDSYRQLQDAFYSYITAKGFDLERGMFIEETGRKHYTIEEYKKITNYDNTKKILNEIKLELPDVPDIADISKFSLKRDEKILEEIIKPKDDLIKELYKDNLSLHKELSKQSKIIDEAQKYLKERNSILADNQKLHNTVRNLEYEYTEKKNTLENEFKDKSFDLEYEYKHKIHKLEKENNHLHKIVDKFKDIIKKFIHWICKKFDMGAEDNLIRDFQKETNTFIDPEKQIRHEEKEKEWDLEI